MTFSVDNSYWRLTALLLLCLCGFRAREVKRSSVEGARKEADEFLFIRPPDPVVDATVLGPQVGRAFEEHDLTNLSSLHFDFVLIGPAAIPFKDRFPDAVCLCDFGCQVLAEILGRAAALRRVIG